MLIRKYKVNVSKKITVGDGHVNIVYCDGKRKVVINFFYPLDVDTIESMETFRQHKLRVINGNYKLFINNDAPAVEDWIVTLLFDKVSCE